MTVKQKEQMLAYIKQHQGRVTIGRQCDVCYVDKKPAHHGLPEYLVRSDTGEYSSIYPNLCPDHGRELGVVW